MSFEVVVVSSVLVLATVLFVTEWLSFDVTAVLVMGLLMVTGVLTPAEGLAGFANPATMTIAAMLGISAALERTGVLQDLSRAIERLARRSERLAIVALLLLVGVASGFINNTAIVAIFIPVLVELAPRLGARPSGLLMPLSFVSILGGVCTLIGTSTNLLVSALVEDHGAAPIGMFELLPVGAAVFVVGFVWSLVAVPRLVRPTEPADDLTGRFQMAAYVTDVELGDALERVDRRLVDTRLLDGLDLDVLEVFREGRAIAQDADWFLQPGDVLRLKGTPEAIRQLAPRDDIRLATTRAWEDEDFSRGDDALVEVVLAADTSLVGRRIRDVDLPRRFGAWILARRAHGQLQQVDLASTRLRGGDSLLLKVDRDRISELRRSSLFVVVSELDPDPPRRDRLPVAAGILAAVVLFAATGVTPIVVAALLGLVALVVTRCITTEELYEAISWKVIVLLGGVISLGTAMDKSGAAAMLARGIVEPLGDLGPHAVLAGVFLLTMLLTNVMSNIAAAALFVPVVFEVAQGLGADPRPFIMAVAYGASLSFMTPIGYQTNTLIYGPGRYRFTDFLRVGTPLSLICAALVVLLVPLVWPF